MINITQHIKAYHFSIFAHYINMRSKFISHWKTGPHANSCVHVCVGMTAPFTRPLTPTFHQLSNIAQVHNVSCCNVPQCSIWCQTSHFTKREVFFKLILWTGISYCCMACTMLWWLCVKNALICLFVIALECETFQATHQDKWLFCWHGHWQG